MERTEICHLLDENKIAIFGATTGGEFINGKNESGSAAILLMELKLGHFQVFFEGISPIAHHEVRHVTGLFLTCYQQLANLNCF